MIPLPECSGIQLWVGGWEHVLGTQDGSAMGTVSYNPDPSRIPRQSEGPRLRLAEHNGPCVVQPSEDLPLSAQLSFLQEPGELI